MVLIMYRQLVLILYFVMLVEWACGQPKRYLQADSMAATYAGHDLRDIPRLAQKLTATLTDDADKFRAIYKWVCDNIANDYDLYIQNKTMREKRTGTRQSDWNRKFNKLVFATLLHERRTICTGYAYLIRELSLHAGLDCRIIDGYGRTAQSNIGGAGIVNHSWNAVCLNRRWYLCDATWSSGVVDPRDRSFIPRFEEAYFLTDPAVFALNHYPVDTAWSLLKKTPPLRLFLDAPLVYRHALQQQVIPTSPSTFVLAAKRDEPVIFQWHSGQSLAGHAWVLQDNGQSYAKAAQSDGGKQMYITHSFTQRGRHVVHILLDGEYVVSYRVEVQ